MAPTVYHIALLNEIVEVYGVTAAAVAVAWIACHFANVAEWTAIAAKAAGYVVP
jgi:hypothetical protein